jgi:enoyl-CoA hydratase/carnithine racemase
VSTAEGVATLWINRPDKRNAITYAMWRGIADFCRRLATDPTVRVLVVRGVGDHFSAGADISGLGEPAPADYRDANEAAHEALATFAKPTVAFITGACVGGGAQIAIACDLRVADSTSRFGITPSRLGIVYPAFAVERTVRLIGPSSTKHLLYSAEIIDAERALRIGLIDEVHEPGAAIQRLAELTSLLAHQRSLVTQMSSKEMVDSVVGTGPVSLEIERRWAAKPGAAADRAEGVAAFLERRAPRFTWTHASGEEITIDPSREAR